MGVYIPGMVLPTDNYGRMTLTIYPNGSVVEYLGDIGRDFGTAIPVPDHGRLIDADAFIAKQQHLYCENCAKRKGMKNGKMKFVYNIGDAPCRACEIMDVLDSLEDAPTVIPAKESEDG